MAKRVSHCRETERGAQSRRRGETGSSRYPRLLERGTQFEGSTVSRLLYQAEEIASRTEASGCRLCRQGDELSQTHFSHRRQVDKFQAIHLFTLPPHRGFLDRHRRDLIGE